MGSQDSRKSRKSSQHSSKDSRKSRKSSQHSSQDSRKSRQSSQHSSQDSRKSRKSSQHSSPMSETNSNIAAFLGVVNRSSEEGERSGPVPQPNKPNNKRKATNVTNSKKAGSSENTITVQQKVNK